MYAESTPNPNTMKFVANKALLYDNSVEYTDASQAEGSPLAQELFRFPFIRSLYIANNFVTVTKQEFISWPEIMNELREYIRDFLNEGKEAVSFVEHHRIVTNENNETGHVAYELPANPTETEKQIIDVLEEYIKPAVEQDGGEIAFRSFEDGVVTVILRGSCSGCPSSTLTLKAGIEQLLKRMVPGVERVEAENG